jgi:BirA family biotin operon repressor/biotin-[acetyl-CoA-carboxylase] ligase
MTMMIFGATMVVCGVIMFFVGNFMADLNLLNKQKILDDIKNSVVKKKCHIEILGSTPSTNDYLKSAETKTNICLAEKQTAGKGRLGRAWHSPSGENIYFSYRWQSTKKINELSGLSAVVGLSIIAALESLGIKNLKIKWPNDIFLNQKKIAGVLIEAVSDAIIIGIGINVNMKDDQNKIDQPWTSLLKETNQSYDRNKIIAQLIEKLFEQLNQFEKTGLNSFLNLWNQYDYLCDQEVQLIIGNKKTVGTAKGINELGQLLIKTKEGTTAAYSSGELSLNRR